MKKSVIITIIVSISILVLSIFMLIFSLIKKLDSKEILTEEKFKQVLNNKNLEITNITNEFTEVNEIISAFCALKENEYEIHLLTFKNNIDAENYYYARYNYLEKNKGNSYINNYYNIKSYAKYTLTSGDNYDSLIRVKNTILDIRSNKKNKAEIKKLVKDFNY